MSRNRITLRTVLRAAALFSTALLSACGGGGGDGGGSGGVGSGGTSYAIGGAVSGLGSGDSVVLEDNGGDNLTVSANGTFTFATKVASGGTYSATVVTQPSGQACTVTAGSGTASANVTTIAVTCANTAPQTFAVGGTLSGLGTGLSVVLQDNGGDNLTVNTNGTFTFATKLASSAGYSVTVLTQPTAQTCTVTQGSGVIAAAAVTNVSVSCATAGSGHTLGGVVIGLATGASVHVRNGADNVAVSTNGAFTFPTALASGATYSVSIGTQPTGQTCAAQNGSGTAGSSNVTNLVVYCTFNVTVATLTGTYDVVDYDIHTVSDSLLSESFDGAGNRSGSGTTNSNTTITSGVSDSGTFVVAPTSALIPELTDNTNNIGGILGADGDVAVTLNHTVSGQEPAISVTAKPLTSATISSLVGTWLIASVTSASPLYGSVATVSIAADGSMTGSETTLSASGVPAAQTISSGAGTIVVANGGGITSGGVGGGSGFLSADSDLLVLTYVTGTNNLPGLSVGIKQGTGLNAATFNGVYATVALGGTSTSASTGLSQTIYAHGDGAYTVDYTENDSGTLSNTTGVTGTYTVAADGAIAFAVQGGASYTGQISADGNVIVIGDVSSGDAPAIAVGVRQ